MLLSHFYFQIDFRIPWTRFLLVRRNLIQMFKKYFGISRDDSRVFGANSFVACETAPHPHCDKLNRNYN